MNLLFRPAPVPVPAHQSVDILPVLVFTGLFLWINKRTVRRTDGRTDCLLFCFLRGGRSVGRYDNWRPAFDCSIIELLNERQEMAMGTSNDTDIIWSSKGR